MNSLVSALELVTLRKRIERIAITKGKGPYRLTSGGWSSYYCDLKLIMLHPEFASMVGKLFVPFMDKYDIEAVGGLATGSIPVSGAISFAALESYRTIPTFYARPLPKESGPNEKRQLSASTFKLSGEETISPGRRVAIVEDTMTTGSSAREALELVEKEGCEVVLVACVIERDTQPGKIFESRGIAFQRLFYTNEKGDLFIDKEVEKICNP